MTDNNYIGNSTTIGKFILIPIATWVLSLAASRGLNLGIDAETLAQILGVLAGLAYSYVDAKYPNTFNWLDNAIKSQSVAADEQVLNPEYEVGVDEDDSI